MTRYIVALMLIFCLNSLSLLAQNFTANPDSLKLQIASLGNEKNIDTWQKISTNFAAAFDDGRLSAQNSTTIAQQLNKMTAIGVRLSPNIEDYLTILTILPKQNVNQWLQVAQIVIDDAKKGQTKNVGLLFDFSLQFLQTNILKTSAQRTWRVDKAAQYVFSAKDKNPQIAFDKITLVGLNNKDSIFISDTKGTLDIFEENWQGQGGKTDWKRGNWEAGNRAVKTAYANLENYTINLKQPGFECAATLHFDQLFAQPQKGTLVNQISAPVEGSFEYPRFETNDKNLLINNIEKDIEFKGGLGLYGDKIQIRGDSLTKATMLIRNDKKQKILRSNSRMYGVTGNGKIVSQDAEISLYFENDSIYHPSLNLDYTFETKQLRLVRGEKASSKIAFMDFYHKMELNTDALEWNLNEQKISFRTTTQKDLVPVTANSFNHFDRNIVENYRIGLQKDPFVLLNSWVESTGAYNISANDFAAQIGNFKASDIKTVIFDLVKDGFIYYDSVTEMIEIREKTRFYARAYRRETDHDNISITSVAARENFKIDLITKDLLLEGVDQLPISNQNKVMLFPSDKNLILNKDRTIKAVGDLVASSADFVRGKYELSYEGFTIKLDSVEKMIFYLPLGEDKPIPVKTPISNLNGVLMIDELDNKSGTKNNKDFPKLIVSDPSFVFFDNEKICNGAYGRDNFFFRINPFSIKSLKDIKPSDLTLDGEMNYGEIFPNIKQQISLQEDMTLGFDKFPTQQNLPTYRNNATFNGEINLTEKGLYPNGTLNFLSTRIKSDKLLYLLDEMKGIADTLVMEEKTVAGVEFPEMHVGNVILNWKPFVDSMEIIKKGPIACFNERMKADGAMLLTKKGLSSQGRLFNDFILIEANKINYLAQQAKSDTAKVILKDKTNGETLINIDTTSIVFNAYNDNASLKPALGQLIKLNQLVFLASTEQLEWDGASRTLKFVNPSKKGVLNSQVPVEDSLLIEFNTALFSVDSKLLSVSGVDSITIGDAQILPHQKQITITPSTRVDSLLNATIEVNNTHSIKNASLQIISRSLFEGSGDYVYAGAGLPPQTIHLDIIKTKQDVEVGKKGVRLRSDFYTVSNANILPEQNFRLDPLMQYKGLVNLDSREKNLTFQGFGKINLSANIDSDWFAFESQIDPKNVSIDLTAPTGEYKDSLQIGLSYSNADFKLYPTFLSRKTSSKDFAVFDARGKLNYKAQENIYLVGDSARINYSNQTGNLLTLNDTQQTLQGNGKIKMFGDLGRVQATIAGSFSHTIADSSTVFNDLVIGLNFELEEKIAEMLQKALADWASENKEIDFKKTDFKKAIPHLFTEEKAAAVLDDLEGKEYFERPDETFNYRLFLVNVDMVWDTLNRSFRSVGDFGLSYAGSKPINSICGGFIEFAPRSSGDQLNLYLELPDPDTGGRAWLFFSYKNGVMEINSSKTEINQAIENVKPSKAVFADKNTGQTYQFGLGSMNKKNNFVVKMRGE